MHKVWKGKMKDKQDQRKKGSKPLNIKSNQTKYSKEQILFGESKMAEPAGQRQQYQVKFGTVEVINMLRDVQIGATKRPTYIMFKNLPQ